ncbi:hypothetical protein A3K24_00955 [candidate division Kazan bacterium RIFCSPHIGHO2_01_FULL_44_14]|uniref:Uncharacterized protein n=1 Tax=candidate division Kazan bacterium RIFCSPLOWO2_01_FULL_45_19 TaxID=1798538 RepID=A0A1F4NQ60_UNCK3|nr:MAG: hypothetical protein A3K51_00955 [candidate division Kazan bacterium RIFCSPLOWO2_01_FULL_45_19]OGB77672.1 MAG: hypothetical protein A3K24_00955 [candidate division Kazan bacterium RIFCSPHIGHO2_01_FULL_44_14]
MSQTLFIFVSNSEFVIWILVIGYYGKAVSWWASPHCYAQSVAGGPARIVTRKALLVGATLLRSISSQLGHYPLVI